MDWSNSPYANTIVCTILGTVAFLVVIVWLSYSIGHGNGQRTYHGIPLTKDQVPSNQWLYCTRTISEQRLLFFQRTDATHKAIGQEFVVALDDSINVNAGQFFMVTSFMTNGVQRLQFLKMTS